MRAALKPSTLSDGITESLINYLARIDGLRVVPRSAVFRHKRTDLDPQALGRELRARLLLTGKVMQRGDRLVVQVDLVDASNERQIWGERFNRSSADIFEVEDAIARQIVEQLPLKLAKRARHQTADRSTDDPLAYDLYLRARHHWARRTPDSMRLAIEYLEAAIARDSTFARAWAGLADTRTLFAWYGLGRQQELFEVAIAAGRTAVRLEPELGEAHAALGFCLCCTGEWDDGLRACERAVRLSPNYSLAHDWLALALSARGRFDEALATIGRAKRVEPLSLVVHHHEAWVNVMAGRFTPPALRRRRWNLMAATASAGGGLASHRPSSERPMRPSRASSVPSASSGRSKWAIPRWGTATAVPAAGTPPANNWLPFGI